MGIKGIIRPPPEIRAVVDKTALFVSKNGRAFESRILNSDKGKTTKFAFLHDTSPFHAYYEDRIRFYETGGKDGDDDDEKKKKKKKEEAYKKVGDVDENKADDAAGGKSKEETGEGGGDTKDGEPEQKGEKKAVAATSSRTQKASVDPVARALLSERSKLQKATQPPSPVSKTAEGEEGEGEEKKSEEGEAKAAAAASTPPESVDMSTLLPKLAPPNLSFIAMSAPSNATPAQLDVMRLTAQFAALTRTVQPSGKAAAGGGYTSFLEELTVKEWNNPLFGFLQPRHGHFAYFTALVDGYCRLLYLATSDRVTERRGLEDRVPVVQLKKGELEEVEKFRKEHALCCSLSSSSSPGTVDGGSAGGREEEDLTGCLHAAAYRAEYGRFKKQVEDKKRREEGGGSEGGGLGGGGSHYVNWRDFVVVETIDFPVDEVVEAPPPPPRKPKRPATAPTLPGEAKKAAAAGNGSESDNSADMDMDTDDEEEGGGVDQEKIEIVSDYKPKVVSHTSAAADLTRTHMIDPITGKSVALADMSEHMRIQLLDPKWAEEKKRFQAKQAESNFVQGDDIAKNISRFAKQRGDIFGSSREELLNQEQDSKKRLEDANRLIREQAAQQPQPGPPPSVGVSASGTKRAAEAAPPRPPPPGPGPKGPDTKRPRVDGSAPSSAKAGSVGHAGVPPPPPPALRPAAPPAAAHMPPPPVAPPAINESAAVPPPPKAAAPPAAAASSPSPSKPPVVPDVVTLSVNIPSAGPSDTLFLQWQFSGQTVDLTVDDVRGTTIKAIKERLRPMLGNMPLNKMQLKSGRGGFVKDAVKLVDIVSGPRETMDLVPKVRGGRK